MAIKIKVLKNIKLGKTLDHKSLGKKAPIDLVVGEVYEVSEKWEDKLKNFPDYIEFIEDEVVDTKEDEDNEDEDNGEDKGE
jgi:hypothetical protein